MNNRFGDLITEGLGIDKEIFAEAMQIYSMELSEEGMVKEVCKRCNIPLKFESKVEISSFKINEEESWKAFKEGK